MGQILHKGSGLTLDVDATYMDGGVPPRQVALGGGRLELSPEIKPAPTIHRRGTTFIYEDGTPVTDVTHLQHLPEREIDPKTGKPFNPRAMAEAFIAQQQATLAPRPPGARGPRPGFKVKRWADNPRKVRPTAPAEQTIRLQVGGTALEAAHVGATPEKE